MNRKILLDVESTGLFPKQNRVVEIACQELLEETLGESFHFYLNPECSIPESAFKIHGINNEKVKNCPFFRDIADNFLNFIADSQIIAHNAEFDRAFINEELLRCKKTIFPQTRFIDTLVLARKKYPHQKNSLDHLCNRFKINTSARADYHGALIDIILLGKVYLRLISKEHLFDEEISVLDNNKVDNTTVNYDASYFKYRKYEISADEKNQHGQFLLDNMNNHLWKINLQ